MSQIKICDWCKQQIKGRGQRGFLKLIDKQASSGKGTKKAAAVAEIVYDLCNKCYEEINLRLQSLMEMAVSRNHRPDSLIDPVTTKDAPSITTSSRKEWIVQVEDEKIAPETPLDTDVATPRKGKTTATNKEGVVDPRETNIKCPHYNKGKIVIPVNKNGEATSRPYQKCRDCGRRVEYSKKEANMNLDSGVNFHDQN